MLVVRKSDLTGKVHSMELDISPCQMAAYNQGALIQNAFPHLSADQREFFMTGITPEEWEATFGGDDD